MLHTSAWTGLQRVVLLLFLGIGLIMAMYHGAVFWVPLAFAGLLSLLFLPLIRRLRGWGWPDWAAIGVCVLILVLLVAVLVGLITYQVNAVAQQWPQVQAQLVERIEWLRAYAIEDLGLSGQRLDAILDQASQSQQSVQRVLGNFIGSFFSSTTNVLLTVVYMVFLLLARQRLKRFLLRLVPEEDQQAGREVIAASERVASSYLGGRLILMAALGAFYAIGFWIAGVPNAFSLAVLAGALSIIPYLGNILGAAIAIAFSIASGEGFTALLGVLATMSLAQVLENNVLQPWVIGSQVQLNPLFTFTAIIAFGLIWGVPGTIVAIPLVGIFKQVCQRVPGLQAIAYVMDWGDET